MTKSIIIGIGELFWGGLFFILGVKSIIEWRVYSYKCTESVSAKIIKYEKQNDDDLRQMQLFPVVCFDSDQRTYTLKSKVFVEKMIPQNVTVRYWKDNPKYFYIEEVGRPRSLDVAMLLGVIAIALVLLGSLTLILQ